MASGWSVPVRLAVAALVAMPPFVVMGTYFPDRPEARRARDCQGLLSWCWAANGVASILGSSLLLLVSMGAGVPSRRAWPASLRDGRGLRAGGLAQRGGLRVAGVLWSRRC